MSRSTVGVGVIGAHRWTRIAHLPGYAASDRARLVAICDTDRARAEALAVQFAIPKIFTDYRELLADPDVDAVDVCTPTPTHRQLNVDAIAAGKHVVCEKPLAETTAEAFATAAAAGERGVRTKVGFAFRYSPAVRRLGTWIADGTLGDIFHVHALQHNARLPAANFPQRHVPPDAPHDRLLPSSIVAYGAHLADLMRWCGGEFRAVCATMRSFVSQAESGTRGAAHQLAVEDATSAIVEFRSGAQGLLQTSYVATGGEPGIELRVCGSNGTAIVRLMHEHGNAETLALARVDGAGFTLAEPDRTDYPPGTDPTTPWPGVYVPNLVRHFMSEIVDGARPECTFLDAARSQSIVDAIVRSHHERSWIALEPESFLAFADE